MIEARELLKNLWQKGIELRVENGGVQVKNSKLLNDHERALLCAHRTDVLRLLEGEASFLEPASIEHIRRLATHIGTIVNCGGRRGLLVGLFRDRAVVDTGKVILSLRHIDISPV